jgi:hypothetical protein
MQDRTASLSSLSEQKDILLVAFCACKYGRYCYVWHVWFASPCFPSSAVHTHPAVHPVLHICCSDTSASNDVMPAVAGMLQLECLNLSFTGAGAGWCLQHLM